MHTWGNDKVDWRGISNAAEYIGQGLRKYGRVVVRDYKEKYGTVRVYCSFGWQSIHDITHPGYAYIQYKRNGLLWKLCYNHTFNHIFFRLLNYLVVPYHIWLYRLLYKRAIKKWPHLREEILRGADWHEFLEHFGWHRVRTSKNGYELYLDWHPDHYSVKYPEPHEEEKSDG